MGSGANVNTFVREYFSGGCGCARVPLARTTAIAVASINRKAGLMACPSAAGVCREHWARL
jgi:hypothetical protein